VGASLCTPEGEEGVVLAERQPGAGYKDGEAGQAPQ
jgi:hypothetical protein